MYLTFEVKKLKDILIVCNTFTIRVSIDESFKIFYGIFLYFSSSSFSSTSCLSYCFAYFEQSNTHSNTFKWPKRQGFIDFSCVDGQRNTIKDTLHDARSCRIFQFQNKEQKKRKNSSKQSHCANIKSKNEKKKKENANEKGRSKIAD